MRKLLSPLIGLFLLVSIAVSGQDVETLRIDFKGSQNTTLAKGPLGTLEEELAPIPYLPTNVVSKYDVINGGNSVYDVMNSSLFLGGSFSVNPSVAGLSVNSTTGSITMDTDLSEGVYSVNYEYGTKGLQSFYYKSEFNNSSASLWEEGPSLGSDLTSFIDIDGKSFIYMLDEFKGYYIGVDEAGDQLLSIIESHSYSGGSERWNGGAAAFPKNFVDYHNNDITSIIPEEKIIENRIVRVYTEGNGSLIYENIVDLSINEYDVVQVPWKGRIHYGNSTGYTKGIQDLNVNPLTISQSAFSDNGNLFFTRSTNTGAELYFIPTIQMLRLVGSNSVPVNPASIDYSTEGDIGNLLISKPIKIYDKLGNPLNVELGDMVIKNPSPQSYDDFKTYIGGFGLTLSTNEGGVWYTDLNSTPTKFWLDNLTDLDVKINGAHSLDTDWEFYFTSSTPDHSSSIIYKAKLNLENLNNIKLEVVEEFEIIPGNPSIDVAITGLGYDSNGCLFFIAQGQKFTISKIFGWGSENCMIKPASISSDFVVVDSIARIEKVVPCLTDTYDLTTEVPDYLKTPASFVYPKGVPFVMGDPIFPPERQDIFNITFKDIFGNIVSDPTKAPVGEYQIYVTPIEYTSNGIATTIKGKFLESEWYYEVNIGVTPVVIDNLLTPPSPDSICFGNFADLTQRASQYDPAIYNIKYFDSLDVELVDPANVGVGMYKIEVEDICTGTKVSFPYEIRQTINLALEFSYPANNCSNVNTSPTITGSGDVSLGSFAFIDFQGTRVMNSGSTTINSATGEISMPKADTTYTVQYLAIDKSTLGCGDFTKDVNVLIDPNLSNPNPSDVEVDNDEGFCSAELLLNKPIIADECTTITGLKITYLGVETTLPVDTDKYVFNDSISIVEYTVIDGGGVVIDYSYEVKVNVDPYINNPNPADQLATPNDVGFCTATLNLNKPDKAVDCVVIESLKVTYNGIETDLPIDTDTYAFEEGLTTVAYVVKDGFGEVIDYSYQVEVIVEPKLNNPNPADQLGNANDVGECFATIHLNKPDKAVDCVVIESLKITYNGVETILDPSTTDNYAFQEGTSTVEYIVKDGLGVIIPFTYQVEVIVEPKLNNPDPQDIQVSNDPGKCIADLALNIPDAAVSCITIEALTITHNSIIENLDPITSTSYLFKEGESTVNYTIRDGLGQLIAYEYKVLVVIDEFISNPDPQSITQANDAGECSAVVTLTKPDILVDCITVSDLILTINGVAASFDPAIDTYQFPVGTSTVKYVFNDTQGNPVLFEYDVVVNDEELPIFSSFPTDMTVDASSPACQSTATWVEPTISDNCSPSIVPVITGIDKDGNDLGTIVNGGTFPYGENTITYTASDDAGNIVSQNFKINVTAAVPPTIDMASFPADVVQCDPNVVLTDIELVVSCGGGTITNDFNENGANASGEYPYGQTTVVTFTVTDDFGTVTDTKKLNVTIYSELTVEIDGPTTVDDSYEFELTSNVSNGPASTYSWTIVSGNGTILYGTESESVLSLTIEGEVVVRLEVSNENGCTAFDEFTVSGNGDCVIPNAITPNGDGFNDKFVIPCLDTYQNNVLKIFDRWGQVVFESSDYQNEWDGTSRNGELLTGSFYYTFSSSNKKTRSGYVIVVR